MSELTFANTDIYIRQAYSESLQSKLATLIANAKNGNEEMLKKQYDIILKAILDFEKKVLNKEFCKGIMSSTNFGYRKKKVKRSKHKGKKPTKALIRMCKRYRIRLTVKRGSKRVPKSEKVLKSQLKNKMKKKH